MTCESAMPVSVRKPGFFYGYVIVAVGFLCFALIFSVNYAFGVFFKPISGEFGWTRAMTAGAFSLAWVTQGVVSIVMGGLNDRFGPRAVLTTSGVLIGAGYMLMSQIGALWQLYFFYGILVGAGLGGAFVPITSTMARWFVRGRGTMTGLVTAGIGVGTLFGPVISNWLIHKYDWRVSYKILGAIVLIGVIVSAQFLRRDPAQMGTKALGEEALSDPAEDMNARGVLIGKVFFTRQFWIASGMYFCYGYALSAILLHLAPHATDLGISAASAASMVGVLGGGSTIGKVFLGMLADKIGEKNVYLLSFALMLASLVWLVFLTQAWALYIFAFVFGASYGGLAAAHSMIIAWLFGMKQHGLIFGVLFNEYTLGCAVGPIIAGYIFDRTHSYQIAFMICAALSLTALVLTALLTPACDDRDANGNRYVVNASSGVAAALGTTE
jgi:MFS transporter, OFA family, oxalate/formate antiporter